VSFCELFLLLFKSCFGVGAALVLKLGVSNFCFSDFCLDQNDLPPEKPSRKGRNVKAYKIGFNAEFE
jgi:hypothetical protein